MPVNTKAVKARINSATSTKKITKAMELVSAAKMRRAVEASTNTRGYSHLMRELLQHLAHIDESNLPLLDIRPVKKILAVLVSSNRGLCGSFNANIFKELGAVLKRPKELSRVTNRDGEIQETPGNPEIHIMGVGRKSAKFAKKYGFHLVAVFDNLREKPTFEDTLPMSQMLMKEYIAGAYDKVVVGFTNFVSSLHQVAEVRQLLPLSPKDLTVRSVDYSEEVRIEGYLFEPNLEEIISTVVPKLIESQLYQMILESTASEQSARMVAMKNASDNATELIRDLTQEYNKARQAAITQEIAEIAGGTAAFN